MHRRGSKYYFSYSTGDTHYIVYAISDSLAGPFTYAGRILEPVQGWTTHHSIVEFKVRIRNACASWYVKEILADELQNKWWLCYHDTSISGENHLRSAKIRELVYDDEGHISLATPQS